MVYGQVASYVCPLHVFAALYTVHLQCPAWYRAIHSNPSVPYSNSRHHQRSSRQICNCMCLSIEMEVAACLETLVKCHHQSRDAESQTQSSPSLFTPPPLHTPQASASRTKGNSARFHSPIYTPLLILSMPGANVRQEQGN